MPKQIVQQQGQGKIIKEIHKYIKENKILMRKHHLVSQLTISFPGKKKVPFLSKIAIKIIAKQGGVLDTRFGVIDK